MTLHPQPKLLLRKTIRAPKHTELCVSIPAPEAVEGKHAYDGLTPRPHDHLVWACTPSHPGSSIRLLFLVFIFTPCLTPALPSSPSIRLLSPPSALPLHFPSTHAGPPCIQPRPGSLVAFTGHLTRDWGRCQRNCRVWLGSTGRSSNSNTCFS